MGPRALNAASGRVHAKCGFVALGPCTQPAPLRGGTVEVDRYSLSRKLWRAERPASASERRASLAEA